MFLACMWCCLDLNRLCFLEWSEFEQLGIKCSGRECSCAVMCRRSSIRECLRFVVLRRCFLCFEMQREISFNLQALKWWYLRREAFEMSCLWLWECCNRLGIFWLRAQGSWVFFFWVVDFFQSWLLPNPRCLLRAVRLMQGHSHQYLLLISRFLRAYHLRGQWPHLCQVRLRGS